VQTFKKLPLSFYKRADTLAIARELIGKILVTQFNGCITTGRIVETEAYAGINDMASHARRGIRTSRTEVMYGRAGRAYVYLCYGIHQMFNIVTHEEGQPHAVLIRAVEPIDGWEFFSKRTGKLPEDRTIARGPGNVAKAFGLDTTHSGIDLLGDTVFLAKEEKKIKDGEIVSTPRIGVDYAGKDALLPYRFILRNNPYVSGKKQQNQY
jgi:DNA-3-methyladenine glycosylase